MKQVVQKSNVCGNDTKCMQLAYMGLEFEAGVPCALGRVVHTGDDFILVKEILECVRRSAGRQDRQACNGLSNHRR